MGSEPENTTDASTVGDRPAKPTALRPIFDRMLRELRDSARWVLWRYEWSPATSKWTKVPYRATGSGKASTTNAKTWTTFDRTRAAYERGHLEADGVGWVIGDGIVGGDIDACRDPATGELTAEAAAILTEMRSYAEVSPSGTGVRYFALGTLPADGRKRGSYEMYDGDGGRYLTITGHQIDGTPGTIERRDVELATVHARHIAAPACADRNDEPRRPITTPTGKGVHLSDAEVLDRMRRTNPNAGALYDGDTSAHGGDHSAADLALAGHLAWWCDYDPEQVDRLFRGSGLMRPKWDNPARRGETYGQGTIREALNGHRPGDGYQGRAPAGADHLEPPPRDETDPGPDPTDVPAEAIQEKPPSKPHQRKPHDAAPNIERIRTPNLVRLSTVEPVDVEHLDDGRLALGKLTLMVGDAGAGKTHIAMSIAANITRGRPPFPIKLSPSGKYRDPANVLALIGEDGLADTIRGRFDAADGDASRFVVLESITVTEPNGETREIDVDLTQLDVLEQSMQQVRPALVIVDPVQVYLGPNADMHKANEVRAALKGIAKLAEKYNAALLIIGHLNKGNGGGKALYRALGSIDFVAIARSVLVVGEHDGVSAIAHAKANLSPKAPTLTYTLEGGNLAWLGTTTATADELTSGPVTPSESPKRMEAADWLQGALEGGPRKVNELRREAETAGIAWRSIERATKDGLVRVAKQKIGAVGTDSYWVWRLEE